MTASITKQTGIFGFVEGFFRPQRPSNRPVDPRIRGEIVVPQVSERTIQTVDSPFRLLANLPRVVAREHDLRIRLDAVPPFRSSGVLD